MFNKKFTIRVRHYDEDYYVVEYAYYFLIPVWTELCFWFELGLTDNMECWSTDLFSYQKAEEIARGLKSIDDVKKYYEPEEAKEADFYRRKKEYYRENVPYHTKYIN